MKNLLIILSLVLLIIVTVLHAENDEWGSWFKESMEMSKENPIAVEYINNDLTKWKEGKNLLIVNFKKYLERNDNSDKDQTTDIKRRNGIISSYNYDNTDPEIDEIVDFFIFVIENDYVESIKINALNKITIIALEGNNTAKDFIFSQVNNTTLSHRMNLQFHLANITIREDLQSLDYLMSLIIKAQEVETTDFKYSSPDEGAIAGFLRGDFFSRRYSKGLDYDYALPLLKQMIFSRSLRVQRGAAFRYYYQTNKTEMRKIYDVCWAKVQDKTTPRIEYVNALYGLQALYDLKDWGKYSMKFKGILIYFETLILKTPTKDGLIYVDSGKETRISKEEKIYFQKRLRSK